MHGNDTRTTQLFALSRPSQIANYQVLRHQQHRNQPRPLSSNSALETADAGSDIGAVLSDHDCDDGVPQEGELVVG